jgi:putative phosphoesterase
VTRLGIVSDVHGNRDGFEACLADMGRVDRLLFTGDLLGYYFEGPAILRRLRELGATCLAGNHDLYFLAHLGRPIAHRLDVPEPAVYRARYGPSLERAASELSAEEIDWLAALPCDLGLEIDGVRLRLVHGSPWRPADEYIYPDHAQLDRFAGLDADLVVMGHTHRPMVHTVGATTLLNTGSCGQPRDGDPRASYGVVDIDGAGLRCEVRRVAYERAPLLARCRELAPETPLPVELLLRTTAMSRS